MSHVPICSSTPFAAVKTCTVVLMSTKYNANICIISRNSAGPTAPFRLHAELDTVSLIFGFVLTFGLVKFDERRGLGAVHRKPARGVHPSSGATRRVGRCSDWGSVSSGRSERVVRTIRGTKGPLRTVVGSLLAAETIRSTAMLGLLARVLETPTSTIARYPLSSPGTRTKKISCTERQRGVHRTNIVAPYRYSRVGHT